MQRVGIVGGGQLALMLAEAARRLQLEPVVLAQGPDDPAARDAAWSWIPGHALDRQAVAALMGQTSVLALEQESRAPEDFAQVLREASREGSATVPGLPAFLLSSDKLKQKEVLKQHALPTSPWLTWDPAATSPEAWLQLAATHLPGGAMLKWARGGYDGRGTLRLTASADAPARLEAHAFIAAAAAAGSRVYAEQLIDFAAELAVVSTRTEAGQLVQYPAVLTHQSHGVCVEVRGPAAACGVTPFVVTAAEQLAARVGEVFGLVGTYAVEFFVGQDAALYVNEVAPRVHNSGHITLDAAQTSQFENHWRALVGLPLGSTAMAPFFGMINILGTGVGHLDEAPQTPWPWAKAYWYGKKESRPGRKLGHINVSAASREQLEERLGQVRAFIEQWWEGAFVKDIVG